MGMEEAVNKKADRPRRLSWGCSAGNELLCAPNTDMTTAGGGFTEVEARSATPTPRLRSPSVSKRTSSCGGGSSACGAEGNGQAITVALQIRPLNVLDKKRGASYGIKTDEFKSQVIVETPSRPECFAFDHIFDEDNSRHMSLFEKCVEPLLTGIIQGYHAAVFAYGQTGAGKSYTMGTRTMQMMQPTAVHPGQPVIPAVIDGLWKREESLRNMNIDVQMFCTFVEIHKESIRDLLAPKSSRIWVRMKDPDPEKDVLLLGVCEEQVTSAEQLHTVLQQGLRTRSTAVTGMNAYSSRSHAIFTIRIRQVCKVIFELFVQVAARSNSLSTDAPDQIVDRIVEAKLHLVDLAGSERQSKSGSEGERLSEACSINQGLLALGNVIEALSEGVKRHVPYRDSILTRILRHAIGGNSKTLMIACVSPSTLDLQETISTLSLLKLHPLACYILALRFGHCKYASRAKHIRNKPVINMYIPKTPEQIALENENKDLRDQVEAIHNLLRQYLGIEKMPLDHFDSLRLIENHLSQLASNLKEADRKFGIKENVPDALCVVSGGKLSSQAAHSRFWPAHFGGLLLWGALTAIRSPIRFEDDCEERKQQLSTQHKMKEEASPLEGESFRKEVPASSAGRDVYTRGSYVSENGSQMYNPQKRPRKRKVRFLKAMVRKLLISMTVAIGIWKASQNVPRSTSAETF